MGPLLVVDAPSLLYRAFYGLPKSITGADGQPVNALLGFANQVLWAVERHAPRTVILCTGAEAAAYRAESLASYHADRPPVPDELAPQWADAPAFFAAFGWAWEDAHDLEADDLLGAYARCEVDAGGTCLIFSGDRDMFQCVNESVSVLYPRGGKDGPELVDVKGVKAKYGIRPDQVPDFIALRGDPSDGIPGAKGIGEKTAGEILRVHGTLDDAIANADAERPRVAAALRNQADELREFRKIATLQPISVACPQDAPTTYGKASEAASTRGMGRLSERLAGLAKKD
ncbi:DNA polymerase I, thermostable [Baekduia alba]|uniref:5'-3' exonuclease n=1 Tax=Baekduia alba TaxID=2997333 RepID=UPI002341702C|nr:5'-3' exonuclease [Baekduia alba]WCB96932.1 DNA polymerase I, thermostable [Baekduia alba]